MANELDFSNKTVLVVGGSSGIGNGIARSFLERNAKVHVWGTRAHAEDYTGIQGSNLSGLIYNQMDVSDTEAIARFPTAFEQLDVLVLSQGIVLYRKAEFEPENFNKVINVNLNSLMACSMKFHGMLSAANGSLIIINSSASLRATRGNPAYNASKCGAAGLTRTLADAWARDCIRVNGIAPGYVDTKLTKATTENTARLKSAIDSIPLGRIGTVVEVSSVALFLASPLAQYMVGQTISVDGGLTLG